MEMQLSEVERCRALFELAINQPILDMPEVKNHPLQLYLVLNCYQIRIINCCKLFAFSLVSIVCLMVCRCWRYMSEVNVVFVNVTCEFGRIFLSI